MTVRSTYGSSVGTGLIFAAVIAIWVAYGVPLALRRHEEATRAGSVTSFSGALRVLTHRKDDADRVTATASPVQTDEGETVPDKAPASQRSPRRHNRRAARLAARRRRRVLLTLLTACAVVGGLSVAGILLPWAPAIPGGLVVGWLVLCRVMVRREIGRPVRLPRVSTPEARDTRARRREARRDERRAAREAEGDTELQVDPDAEMTVILSGQIEDHEPARRNVMVRGPLPEGALDQQVHDAIASATTSGTTLWDPVPVTLPTYVTKPAVARTVRTIDFGDGAAGTGAGESDSDVGRRAVGD